MKQHNWSVLNNQQVGTYAEYFVKMEFTKYGYEVYTTEIDDRGIDFVARKGLSPFIEIQVKSLRSYGYVFIQKSKIKVTNNSYVALGLMFDNIPPQLFLIPSTVWHKPNSVFVDRKYEGLKSKPEYGINISKKNMPVLEAYNFYTTLENISKLTSDAPPLIYSIVELPRFSSSEKDIIKKALPAIIDKLDFPEEYFINSISVTETNIYIRLLSLSHLQSVVLDGEAIAIFTKDIKLIALNIMG